MSTDGFRLGFANVVAAIRGTLADAVNAGAISAGDFAKLQTAVAGGSLQGTWLTGEIDFATAANDILILPGLAGHYPRITLYSLLVIAATGVQTQGPLVRSGTNVGHNNVTALQTSAGYSAAAHAQAVAVNPCWAGVFTPTTAGGTPAVAAAPAAGDVFLDIVTPGAGTGGYTLRGHLLIEYSYVPIP